MRRVLVACALLAVGPSWACSTATGQDVAVTAVGHAAGDHVSAGAHHHHHLGFAHWMPWTVGVPFVWSGAYTPAFPSYSPVFLSFAPAAAWVPRDNNNVNNAAPARHPQPADAAPAAKPKLRTTNPQSKAKAGKFIAYGDANFGKQKYLSAVERYKTAAQIAPDMAEAYFRQGYALIAMSQYAEAFKAFRRGLGIRGEWHDSAFRLDQLYAGAGAAKTAHLENLAKAVEANPMDSDLLVALGMQLFFDGQRARSELFFARAAQLGANDDRLLDDFVPRPGPAGAREEPGARQNGGKIVF